MNPIEVTKGESSGRAQRSPALDPARAAGTVVKVVDAGSGFKRAGGWRAGGGGMAIVDSRSRKVEVGEEGEVSPKGVPLAQNLVEQQAAGGSVRRPDAPAGRFD